MGCGLLSAGVFGALSGRFTRRGKSPDSEIQSCAFVFVSLIVVTLIRGLAGSTADSSTLSLALGISWFTLALLLSPAVVFSTGYII